jgi:hypothetical protein
MIYFLLKHTFDFIFVNYANVAVYEKLQVIQVFSCNIFVTAIFLMATDNKLKSRLVVHNKQSFEPKYNIKYWLL